MMLLWGRSNMTSPSEVAQTCNDQHHVDLNSMHRISSNSLPTRLVHQEVQWYCLHVLSGAAMIARLFRYTLQLPLKQVVCQSLISSSTLNPVRKAKQSHPASLMQSSRWCFSALRASLCHYGSSHHHQRRSLPTVLAGPSALSTALYASDWTAACFTLLCQAFLQHFVTL